MKKILLTGILLLLVGCRIPTSQPERVIVAVEWNELQGSVAKLIAHGIEDVEVLDIISAVSCYLTPEQQALLTMLLPVRYIEPDYQVFLVDGDAPRPLFVETRADDTATETIDWGLRHINAEAAWTSTTGQGVRVGIIDTGIAHDHPDLAGAVVGGYNAIDGGSYYDDNNHGTYVASVVAARKNGVGIVGVAPDALLYAIKVLDRDGRGYASDVVQGYEWALREELQVVNLSLGSKYESVAMREAMTIAGFQGMGTIAAAGNDGTRGLIYPARNAIAVCVGASNINDLRCSWSNYGPALKANGVLAPGDWVLAANRYGTWQRVSGTSIAAPHVTGIVALLLGMNYCLRDFIFEGASQWEDPDEFRGHGLVDARKSVDAMINAGGG